MRIFFFAFGGKEEARWLFFYDRVRRKCRGLIIDDDHQGGGGASSTMTSSTARRRRAVGMPADDDATEWYSLGDEVQWLGGTAVTTAVVAPLLHHPHHNEK